jgi:hypothetical protein
MNCIKTILALAFISCCTIAHAQQASIASDSVVLKLTITTATGEKLQTEVYFNDVSNKTVAKCTTDKNGNATCTLSTGANYKIRIPNSADSYEYDIPDFAISPVSLTFKFNLKPKDDPTVSH